MQEAVWRRFGWQQLSFVAPADWYLTKVSLDRSAGELWMADAQMERLQIKWSDTSREKNVKPGATLSNYLQHLERAARRRKLPWQCDRDLRLAVPAQPDASSVEAFHWSADIESYGAIWYSPQAQRVTLFQVNGPLGGEGLRHTARRVITSLLDASSGDADLWTAQDLTCSIPASFGLTKHLLQTGHTELGFTRGKLGEAMAIARYGLASIVLERAGDLGDWVDQQRFKLWHTYRLERDTVQIGDRLMVRFRGSKAAGRERLRRRLYALVGLPLPIYLTALCWHDAESNSISLVEYLHSLNQGDLAQHVAQQMPSAPILLPPPK